MSLKYNLSEGALEIIMKGGDVQNPIMQVLGCKKINSGQLGKERYRVLLSDGKHSITYAMFTTQMKNLSLIDGLENFTVIKINRLMTSVINNASKRETRVLLLIDFEIVAPGSAVGETIGNPVALVLDESSQDKPSTNIENVNRSNNISNDSSSSRFSSMDKPLNNISQAVGDKIISPIASLSPYHNRWVIKARVTTKSPMRTWSNARGEGKLFNMDLVDESGEIRCTAFRDMAEKFYDIIQEGKIYFISKCQLKQANKQFNSTKNDYEMTMMNDTIIEECHEEIDNIPQIKYDFVSLDKVALMEVGSIVDVIGICQSVTDLRTFTSKTTNRELKNKNITLVDQSKKSITLTIWGDQAETFDGTDNPVIVIRGTKIGEFGGGKNLSNISGTLFKVNPDIPECHRMKGWYSMEGNNLNFANISAQTGTSLSTPWMTFKEVNENRLGAGDKGDYYLVMATILLIRHENAIYKACPTESCNKKIIDMENGMYRCEKCNQEFPNFQYRLLATMNLGDWSGNQWVTMFSSECEKVLGKTAQEVGELMEENSELGTAVFESANFKQFIFKCRAKFETYNDESRLKTIVISVDPINYETFNNYLIEKINELTRN